MNAPLTKTPATRVHEVQSGLTLAELQSALLRLGQAYPDGADVARAACAVLDELTAMRSEMKVRALAGRAQLSRGNTAEAVRMFDSIAKIAGQPHKRFDVLQAIQYSGSRT